MTPNDVYISHLDHAPGKQVPLTELPEVIAAGNAERLAAEGLGAVWVSDAEPWELAAHSAEGTLKNVEAGMVDSVYYATDSFWVDSANVKAPARLLDRLGMGRVPLHGVGFEGCANTGALLHGVANAVRAGTTSAALCVTTDRAAPGARLMGANVSVLADGAASFLARGTRPEVGFRLVAIGSAMEAGMHRLNVATDTMAVVKATADGIGRATSLVFERAGLDRSAVSHIVTNNYGRTSLRIFCAAANVPFDLHYNPGIEQVGHCFAADTLITLETMVARNALSRGEFCLVLWSGFSNWSAAIVEYLD